VRRTDLTTHVIERVARENVPIGMYGGTPELLEVFGRVLSSPLVRRYLRPLKR
jgi:N-acetylglucosaminyldiphosphoundecaprenol N-acetyl-beta-D-mannosaminyltransferase